MLVRQAHEITWIKKNHLAKSPETFQRLISERCDENGIIFYGFIGDWFGGQTRIRIGCENGHIWEPTIAGFINSNKGKEKPCPHCTGRKAFAKDIIIKQIEEVCKNENIIFVGFDGEYKGKSKSRIVLKCEVDGHQWNVSVLNFLYYKSRCPKCGTRRQIDSTKIDYATRIKQIEKLCKKNNMEFVDAMGELIGIRARIKVKCSHGHETIQSLYNFVYRHSGCPKCTPRGYQKDKSGTFYIQKLTNTDGMLSAIKFGITNLTTLERMKNQSRVSKFDHEIFYELTLQDGQKILELENKIKEAMKGKTSYISKEDMPDGYTETVAPSELSTIMYIVKSFEKELTK